LRFRHLAALALAVTLPLVAAEGVDPEIPATLAFLTSPGLGGRGASEPGGEVAARFLANRLASMGWLPAGDATPEGRSFFQTVPAIAATYDPGASWIETRKNDGKLGVRVAGSSGTGGFRFVPDRGDTVVVESKLVFAGFGIRAPEHAHDDYAKLDVGGKTVLVFSSEPREQDETSPWNGARATRHALASTKQRLAESLGARALLIVPNPAGKAKSAADLARDEEASWLGLAAASPSIPVVYVDAETAKLLLQGSRFDLEKVSKQLEAGKPVAKELRDRVFGLHIAMKDRKDVRLTNVVARLGVENAASAILLGAHWDGLGEKGGAGYQGADDNASGVAAAMAAAKALKASPPRSADVYLALWTGEERGLLGSRHFVAHPPALPLRAAVNLDMLGRNNLDRPDYANVLQLIYSARAPILREIATSANHETGWDLRFYGALRFQPISDHASLAEAGIPVVYPFSGYEPDYHTPADTRDKVLLERIDRSARYVEALVRLLAEKADSIRLDPSIEGAPPADAFERGY